MGEPGESTDLDDGTSLNRSTYDRIAPRYVENQIRQESGNNNLFASLEKTFLTSLPSEGLLPIWVAGRLGSSRFGRKGSASLAWTFRRGCWPPLPT